MEGNLGGFLYRAQVEHLQCCLQLLRPDPHHYKVLKTSSTTLVKTYIFFFFTLIITSGDRHINFWRIVTTSSGVKMDVTSGMFNNKPVTDIESFVQLGDGKVVTGCEWGNLLLWEKGKVGDF